MKLEFNNLNDINRYYENLNIKPYWLEESLGFNIVKEITLIFNDLHNLYPDVVIKEIGDCYSYDKIEEDKFIIFVKDTIIYDQYPDHIKNADEKIKIDYRRYLVHQLLKYNDSLITKEHDKIGKRYTDLDYEAKYYSSEHKIMFNHAIMGNYKKNTVHEFGHAIAYQYDLNRNEEIAKIYKSLNSYEIEKNVSEYAKDSIYEFIAEVFTQDYYFNMSNYVIQQVMNILNKKVQNNKAKSNIDIVKDKIFKR